MFREKYGDVLKVTSSNVVASFLDFQGRGIWNLLMCKDAVFRTAKQRAACSVQRPACLSLSQERQPCTNGFTGTVQCTGYTYSKYSVFVVEVVVTRYEVLPGLYSVLGLLLTTRFIESTICSLYYYTGTRVDVNRPSGLCQAVKTIQNLTHFFSKCMHVSSA